MIDTDCKSNWKSNYHASPEDQKESLQIINMHYCPNLFIEICCLFQVCKKCHELCTECKGSDASNCLTCKFYLQSEHCVQNCYPFYYSDAQDVCQQCNEQCRGGCYGPTAEDCTACKNFKVYSDDPEKEKQVSISIIKSFWNIFYLNVKSLILRICPANWDKCPV